MTTLASASNAASAPVPFRSNARITAIGSYVPAGELTNEDLSRMVDTNDEWIVRRTGIISRRRAAADEFSSHLAIAAVRDLQSRYPDAKLSDVDVVLVATTTPDMPFPSVASQVQRAFGMPASLAADLNAACAGFVSALQMAGGLLLTGAYRKALVIGAETLTKITDYTDRSTCILFGDGAGAVLLEAGPDDGGSFLASFADTNGAGGADVYCTGLSDRLADGLLDAKARIVQNGREVYKWAVSTVPDAVRALTARAGVAVAELDWFVPHSANLRMIEAMCERLDLPLERALHSVAEYGNTSAASIPLALSTAARDGRLAPGQLVALVGFGSGLTQAGLLLRWTCQPG